MEKYEEALYKFIEKMEYLDNQHVTGIVLYGSYLTGYSNSKSDIDVNIIMDNSHPVQIIRGSDIVDGYRIEYFEKPISDLYASAKNDFNRQCNALLSIIGRGKIIYDRTGNVKELQNHIINMFEKPLPGLSKHDAQERVSIINNRMEKVEAFYANDNIMFERIYYLTVEKIMKFYHQLTGCPEIQTSKVYRVYTDLEYRTIYQKGKIPEEEFINKFLAATNPKISFNNDEKIKNIRDLYAYAKRNVIFDEEKHRIPIKSRNIHYHR